MWTAILTLLAFVLLPFHGDAILAFAAEQLHQRRAHRLRLEQERTRQALIGHDRDALVWRQLEGPDQAPSPPSDRTSASDGGTPGAHPQRPRKVVSRTDVRIG